MAVKLQCTHRYESANKLFWREYFKVLNIEAQLIQCLLVSRCFMISNTRIHNFRSRNLCIDRIIVRFKHFAFNMKLMHQKDITRIDSFNIKYPVIRRSVIQENTVKLWQHTAARNGMIFQFYRYV